MVIERYVKFNFANKRSFLSHIYVCPFIFEKSKKYIILLHHPAEVNEFSILVPISSKL